MNKFFAKPNDTGDIELTKEDINHIYNVLRLRKGDDILVCDGKKNDYTCRILEITGKTLALEKLSLRENTSEPPVKVVLYQGLPKSDKMELIIQKCVELGIEKIVPVETERSVVKIKDGGEKKIIRWQSISLSAAKQSGRGIVPEIGSVIKFEDAVKQMAEFDLALVPYELEQELSLSKVLKLAGNCKSISIFIGPEGGITHEEISLAKEKGIYPVTLGSRILRTETAGFAALIMILYELGMYDN